MHGHLRVGGHWRPFDADQLLSPTSGYIWAATARFGALPVAGFDRYSDGTAEMRWKILGLLPVVTATGSDLIRSAAGRFVAEIVLAPTSFAVADWESTKDPDTARGSVSFPHGTERVDVHVGADGDVLSASMQRWGNPHEGPFARHAFGADLSESKTFGQLRIPTRMRAGWGWGTDGWESGEFFRATITDAVLLGVPGPPRPSHATSVALQGKGSGLPDRHACGAASDSSGAMICMASGSRSADHPHEGGVGRSRH
jgi:hypothetical protein